MTTSWPPIFVICGRGESAALAAKAATSTIPIALSSAAIRSSWGLAANYNRPGGNATGISILTSTLEAKRLRLLHELVPQAATIGVLLNPNFPSL